MCVLVQNKFTLDCVCRHSQNEASVQGKHVTPMPHQNGGYSNKSGAPKASGRGPQAEAHCPGVADGR